MIARAAAPFAPAALTLADRGGHIRVDKRGGFFRDVDINLPDYPDWHSFKFRLTSTGRMTRGEWERFVLSQFASRPENARHEP